MSFLQNMGSGVANSATQGIINQQMANIAYRRSSRSYKSRYVDTMQDLKNAGLNPILAASGGFNVGSGVTAQMPRGVDSPAAGALAFAQSETEEDKQKNLREENVKIRADALNIVADTAKKRAEARLLTRQEAEALKRITKMNHEIDVILQQKRLNEENISQAKSIATKLQGEIYRLKGQWKFYATPMGELLQGLKALLKSFSPF